jgi:Spy/CpxP family protein refolding chaperone
MTNIARGRLLAVAFLLASVAPALAQRAPMPPPVPVMSPLAPPGFPWWKLDHSRKELGLTADQSARIDRIWEGTRPELRAEWDELSRLENKLSRMIQNDADEAALARQIDRLETARANVNKTRSLMLVQMMKVLKPEQRTRLTAMQQRYEEDLKKQQFPTAAQPAPPAPQGRKKD